MKEKQPGDGDTTSGGWVRVRGRPLKLCWCDAPRADQAFGFLRSACRIHGASAIDFILYAEPTGYYAIVIGPDQKLLEATRKW